MLSSYSYSALDSFNTCPRQFKFAYVDRVPTAPKIMADMYLGSAVHRVLARLYTLGADGVLMPLDDAVKAYHDEWEKLDREKIAVGSEYYTVDDYIRIGWEMLERYYQKHQPFREGTLLGAEMFLTFELPGTPFKFKAIIDRLFRRDDGTVEICDYKTGQRLIQPTERRFFYQMGIYQLAVRAQYPDFGEIELSQYFLRKDTAVRLKLKTEDLEVLTEELRTAVMNTLAAARLDDYPAQEGPHCGYCDYLEVCPAKIHRRLLDEGEGADDKERLTAQKLKELADEFLERYERKRSAEAEFEAIKEEIIEAARQSGLSRFDGSRGNVNINLARTEEFVTKTRDAASFAELSAIARELNLEEYFRLDQRGLMKDIYLKKRLPEDQLKRLEPFVVEVERSRVTARLKADTDTEAEHER